MRRIVKDLKEQAARHCETGSRLVRESEVLSESGDGLPETFQVIAQLNQKAIEEFNSALNIFRFIKELKVKEL